MFSLQGKKALVTGSSRGIGRGIALSLAKQGAAVVINYNSSEEKAAAVVEEIKQMGQEAFAIRADVGNLESIAAMYTEVKKNWGKLDIQINNAGILQYKPFDQVTGEDWDKMIAVNLRGQYFCAQEAAKLMKDWGRIINISSISSGGMGIAYPMISHYTTSKGGVVGMTEALAVELGPKGITVNAIAPGAINTDMGGAGGDEKVTQALMARL